MKPMHNEPPPDKRFDHRPHGWHWWHGQSGEKGPFGLATPPRWYAVHCWIAEGTLAPMATAAHWPAPRKQKEMQRTGSWGVQILPPKHDNRPKPPAHRGEFPTSSEELTKAQVSNFERAFTSGTSGIRRTCNCGREFYDSEERIGWETGELEELRNDPEATGLEHPVGSLVIGNIEYVDACDCWHPRARNIVAWITEHRREIGAFYKLEAADLKALSDTYPQA